ncbi:Diphthamide biosynthesis protein 3 [Ceratobasidium sp. 394]|nr:Diphthamide biosynthesis protein 3 [Ceratobasidium sp. 394]
MGISYYDEVEIEDMVWDETKGVFHYPCPCGDRFEISRQQLANYEDVATCPSCSLIIRVIYDPLDFEDDDPGEEDGDSGEEEEGSDGTDDEGRDEKFEDAMENLNLNDEPTVVTLVETRA